MESNTFYQRLTVTSFINPRPLKNSSSWGGSHCRGATRSSVCCQRHNPVRGKRRDRRRFLAMTRNGERTEPAPSRPPPVTWRGRGPQGVEPTTPRPFTSAPLLGPAPFPARRSRPIPAARWGRGVCGHGCGGRCWGGAVVAPAELANGAGALAGRWRRPLRRWGRWVSVGRAVATRPGPGGRRWGSRWLGRALVLLLPLFLGSGSGSGGGTCWGLGLGVVPPPPVSGGGCARPRWLNTLSRYPRPLLQTFSLGFGLFSFLIFSFFF